MKFKSQIATTVEQSKRLLELGLKAETADMLHYKSYSMKEWCILATPYDLGRGVEKFYQPAWSLHRLIELLDVYEITLDWKFGVYEQAIRIFEERMKDGLIRKEYLK